MKRALAILLFGLLATVTAPAQSNSALPSIDQILDKYIAASGGKAAMEKITSRIGKGTFDLPAMGINGTVESYNKAPNKTASVVSIPGFGEVKQGYDGTTAWAIDPMTGSRTLSGVELAQYKRGADLHSALRFKEHYPKATVTGKDKVGDRDVYVVEAVPTEGGPEKFYFDAETGLLLRHDFVAESPQGQMPLETYREDYKEVDGVKIPHTVRQVSPAMSFSLKFTSFEHNAQIDDAKFAKPAGQ